MALKTASNPLMDKMHKALAYQKGGEYEKAQRLYKQVLKKAPNNPDANHLLGVCYRQLGYPKRAMEYIRKAIGLADDRAPFYANLARTFSDMPDIEPETILATTQKALSLDPTLVEAQNLKAISLTRLERYEEAEEIFQQLIVRHPDYSDAYRNYGLLLRDNKEFKKAVVFFHKAVQLQPDIPENYVHRARAWLETNDLQVSRKELEKALERFPDNSDLLHEMARLLFKLGESYDGLQYIEKAIKTNPDNPHQMVTLGVSQHSTGSFQEAIKTFKQALKISPLSAAKWNLSLAYLGNGQLGKGWDLHNARFEDKNPTTLCRTFDRPDWDGSDIRGKTIMVWNDQGVGDAIRSGTMLPELIEIAGHVIVEVSQKLVGPFASSFPEAETRVARFEAPSMHATADDYDCQLCLTDLARFFRRDIASFRNAKQPVFRFDKARAQELYKRIPERTEKPIVGVSWRSRNLSPGRAKNYLSAPELAPILETPDIVFVNLQYSFIERELKFLTEGRSVNLQHFPDVDQFNNLEDAAALAACCDLIITANTSIADISGSYGFPCWCFGQEAAHFHLGEDQQPWYDSMDYIKSPFDQPVADLVPVLVERLENWKDTFSPEPRLERLGLAGNE